MSKLRLIKPKSYIVEIDGKDYELSMTMASFALIEERYGSVEQAFKQVEQSNVRAVLFCLWACLNEQIAETNFYSYIGIGNLKDLADILADLVKSSMPAEELEGNTPTAKK